MFSFGIEPSITSTNGASSSSRTAWRNGSRNSSPPSVGESTLLCRCTFGMPGIAPSRTSSMPGWPAAVMETESPSQLIPSEIHRMWTSSTPAGASSTAMRDLLFLHVQGLNQQLLAGDDLDVGAPAGRADQREPAEPALAPARPAAAGGGHLLQHELDARRQQLERELERRRHHLAQVAHRHLHPGQLPPTRVAL